MNNTFNINRFGKILKHDGLNFFPNIILALAIIWAIPVIVFLFTSLMPSDETTQLYDPFSRIDIISTLSTIVLIIAPARLYKTCNDPRKGIVYAMLPASTLEKFLSMVFYCVIVTPIIYIVGALAIDTFLALFNGPYEGFAVSYYFDTFAKINAVFERDNVTIDESWILYYKSLSPTFMIILSARGTLTISSIFMFGNMIFKRHKTGKMIGILIILFIIFMIILINYAVHTEVLTHNIEDKAEFVKYTIFLIMNAIFYAEIIVSALMLFGVYRKLKTQKY